jgi:hypothetical protein
MRYFIVTSIICFLMLVSKAQQNHYIYIQTENKQPFYIKLDKKLYTSTIFGYLIIPKLIDGKYNSTIGFPKDEWPVQNISFDVMMKDQGFILKNFGQKGWGFFNLQNLNIIMASQNSSGDVNNKNTIASDEFSSLLSNVVKDPSIKTSEIKAPTNYNASNYPIDTRDKNIQQSETSSTQIQTAISTVSTKLNQTSSNNVLTIIYRIKNEIQFDTIIINIDEQAPELVNQIQQPDQQLSTIPIQVSTIPIDTFNKVDENINSSLSPKLDSATVHQPTTITPILNTLKKLETTDIVTSNTAQVISNSNCKNQSSEDDFLKLRKKMAAVQKDEAMLILAKKYFKQKCFSTEQIKNLATLFLNDQSKYNFLDTAYPFVSDSFNFPTLQTLLTDEYYLSRFKAMIRH